MSQVLQRYVVHCQHPEIGRPVGETHDRLAGMGTGDSMEQYQAWGCGMGCQGDSIQLSSLGIVMVIRLPMG